MFYLPSVFVGVCLLLVALAFWRQGRKGIFALCASLVFPPLLFVVCIENRWSHNPSHPVPNQTYRMVHWNVCRGHLGWNRVLTDLRDLKADIYVLSEIPKGAGESDLAAQFGSDFEVSVLRDMGVIARGKLGKARSLAKRRRLDVFEVAWKHEGRHANILVVDVASSLNVIRDPLLQELTRLIKETEPDIIVGDFNAPRRSRAICPLPAGFSHAYDVSGCGWSYTWPVPMPMLAIDQCILGERVLPARYELRSTVASDHRLQVLDFAIK